MRLLGQSSTESKYLKLVHKYKYLQERGEDHCKILHHLKVHNLWRTRIEENPTVLAYYATVQFYKKITRKRISAVRPSPTHAFFLPQ